MPAPAENRSGTLGVWRNWRPSRISALLWPPRASTGSGSLESPVMRMADPNADNHANQLNPNNDAYWQSRGEEERPEDWEDRIE